MLSLSKDHENEFFSSRIKVKPIFSKKQNVTKKPEKVTFCQNGGVGIKSKCTHYPFEFVLPFLPMWHLLCQ